METLTPEEVEPPQPREHISTAIQGRDGPDA